MLQNLFLEEKNGWKFPLDLIPMIAIAVLQKRFKNSSKAKRSCFGCQVKMLSKKLELSFGTLSNKNKG